MVKYNKDGSVAKKRGRPRKIKQEIEAIVDEAFKQKEEIIYKEEIPARDADEIIDSLNREANQIEEDFQKELDNIKTNFSREWDVTKDQHISYFDANLSYELTGYKPLTTTKGLDFRPEWFTETRDKFKRTNHYCQYPRGTKAFNEFWDEQYRRCRNGYTVNGYTVTGDHYFFLNFYQLDILTDTEKAGGGRRRDFPNFFAEQYKYFHYLEMCKQLRKNCVMMKARGVGFSEMDASLVANSYNCRRNTTNVVAAYDNNYLEKTLNKIWDALAFLNDKTDGGFFKLRQVKDTDLLKRASVYKIIDGQKVETGWMSQIQGINADKPRKIRGDRTDLLFYEEGGSWPNSLKAFQQGDALVGIQGAKFGIKIIGGTGGDSGPNLEGLRKIYESPKKFDVLPFRHNYTPTGATVDSGFFIPAFNVVNNSEDYPDVMDNRGFTNPEKGKKYYLDRRAKFVDDQEALLTEIAEYCFTAEEGFSQEGDNKFNKVNITQQLTRIRALKECPKITTGSFNLIKAENKIVGSVFVESPHGKVQILEPPLWETDGGDKIDDLYVAGIDGIDIGKAQTSSSTKDPSDFCIVIKKRAYGLSQPKYVAMYKDRPYSENDAYKIAIGLAMYYNAKINIEASRLSMLTWCKEKKLYHWFMQRPVATYSDLSKKRSTAVGTPATPAIINHQTDLIKEFTDEYCDDLWFEEILDELHRYSDDAKRKFDCVASMAMAELADEELNIQSRIPRQMKPPEVVKSHLGYYYDERGYKHYGIIPDEPRYKTNFTEDSFYHR